ncbi:MAG: tetratricopeptide repeat-containing sulfotransferase family protein [Steroidobacteraceae bacterium]
MSAPTQPVGNLDAAMAHAARLLDAKPALAAEQALEILKAVPEHPPAVLLLAAARRRAGDPVAALKVLVPLLRSQGAWAAAHFERSLALAAVGRGDEAILALRRTVELKPEHSEAWRILADHLVATGDTEGGDAAYARHIQCAARNPALRRAALAMVRNDMPQAETLLKSHLRQAPTDVPAIRMLAEVAMRCGHDGDARNLLERCLELAPTFAAARYQYAVLLHRHNDAARALAEIERLLVADPRNPAYRNLCAVILSRVGEYQRSSRMYAELLKEYPGNAKVWLSYGHVLKTEGRQDGCVDAYRRSLDLDPLFGESWWSLANIKTFRFAEADLATMQARLTDPALDEPGRVHLHFALGKACEDAGDFRQSFEHYSKGNAAHRARNRYDADLNSKRLERLKEVFTRGFFVARLGQGCEADDPVFIVGMPRSGSTLLEQILSSHPAVEGTTELPEIVTMAKELRGLAETEDLGSYAGVLASMAPAALREMGERYLARTRIHRKTDRRRFIDKMPNNFLHVGLIHLVLPNATIIDARRHPLACCFSNFKQHYARGQRFSYDLTDMGRFYRDYVDLMAHFDQVLPGRVHRVCYERMVEDTESEVRRLLDCCGLPFEPGCLRFFENERPVRTASSEQVRQPIYREGIDHWRHFEEWLDPLRSALGPVLDAYPAVPRSESG